MFRGTDLFHEKGSFVAQGAPFRKVEALVLTGSGRGIDCSVIHDVMAGSDLIYSLWDGCGMGIATFFAAHAKKQMK